MPSTWSDGVLNFAEFDAVAEMLDLKILPAQKHDFAAAVPKTGVAGPVNPFRVVRIEGILHEPLGGPFGVVVIAQRQRTSAHADFARLVHLGGLVLIVQNQDVCVAARETDGQFFVVGKLAVHDEISAGDGDFNRPVKIDEHRSGQMAAPVIEMLGGENLTDEEDFFDAIQLRFRQQILVGDVDHDGRHPENEIDGMGRQKLDQLDREGGALSRE